MGAERDRCCPRPVQAATQDRPDWRDAEAYAPLLGADRSLFAWEWLRRDPAYRDAAERAPRQQWSREARRWGLVAFEAPALPAPLARPVWSAACYPYVLGVLAGPGEGADAFELEPFEGLSTVVPSPGGQEHLLICDGLHCLRVDVLAGTLGDGPAALRYLLEGLAWVEPPLLTLRRLLALWRSGSFSRLLHRREARARRWVLMLRAHDALSSGADQRAIAEMLLNRGAHAPRWRSEAPSLRSQAQRLVRGARAMAAGGYLRLLR